MHFDKSKLIFFPCSALPPIMHLGPIAPTPRALYRPRRPLWVVVEANTGTAHDRWRRILKCRKTRQDRLRTTRRLCKYSSVAFHISKSCGCRTLSSKSSRCISYAGPNKLSKGMRSEIASLCVFRKQIVEPYSGLYHGLAQDSVAPFGTHHI